MLIAFLVKCPKCGNFWHPIIGDNPCYDTCPHCKTEFLVKVTIELKGGERDGS